MSRYGKRPDMVVHEAEPFNAETGLAALGEDVVTATDAFYVRGHGEVPEIDPAAWRLHVNGAVDRELVLSLETLREALREREVTATLQCAGNRRAGLIAVRDIPGEAPWGPGATGTAKWTGVGLGDVLALAGPRGGHVGFEGADVSSEAKPSQRFGGSIRLEKACRPEVLLAWAMNGAPLPVVHGAPLRVGAILGPQNTSTGRDRRRGIRVTLASAGIDLDELPTLEGPFIADTGHEAMQKLMSGESSPTVVICGNDTIAIGALNAASGMGLSVPEDVSIVGFDDLPIAGWELVQLTTVRQPMDEMARVAARTLVARIEGRALPGRIERTVFEPELVIRRTLGPPRT